MDKIKVITGKIGLDDHYRGIIVVSNALRNAGMEVVYLGAGQRIDGIINTIIQYNATKGAACPPKEEPTTHDFGSERQNLLPSPAFDSSHIEPSSRSRILETIVSPSPYPVVSPLGLRRWNNSNIFF